MTIIKGLLVLTLLGKVKLWHLVLAILGLVSDSVRPLSLVRPILIFNCLPSLPSKELESCHKVISG